jgi:transcription elongation GreA/GreB family factor
MNHPSQSNPYHQHCMDLLVKRGDEIRAEMDAVQQSANSETKSTAGDKHETARAMAQLEVEMLSKQLEEVNKSIALLKRIPTTTTSTLVQHGSVVETSIGTFYLSVGLGNFSVEGKNIMSISTESPLSMAIMGKQAGEKIEWRGQWLYVIAIK